MKIDVQNSSGKVVDSISLDKKIFNIEVNHSVVRQAVLSELSNLRQGTHSSKIDLLLEVVVKSLGSKKVAGLQELVQ